MKNTNIITKNLVWTSDCPALVGSAAQKDAMRALVLAATGKAEVIPPEEP